MIYERSLLREMSNYSVAVFVALLGLASTSVLVRFLGRAAGGTIPLEAVLGLVGFTALNYIPILLTVTLFVAVIAGLSRSHRFSEMVIWSGAGLSPLAWVRPVLMFAGPLVVVIALLVLVLSPWANERADEYRARLEAQEDVSLIAPGVFRELPNGKWVFFVESMSPERQTVENVFISGKQRGRDEIIVSRRGYLETNADGDRYLVGIDGWHYEGVPGTAEYRVAEFQRAAVLIQPKKRSLTYRWPRAVSTLELVRASGNRAWRAELMWRIGLPLVALNLALLAIPLASVNPRATRSLNLLFAVFAYFVYINLLSILQAWVAQGRLSFAVGWWSLHAGVFAITLLLFWYRSTLRFGLRWRS